MSEIDQIRDTVLKLSTAERAALARDLLVSLDDVETDSDSDQQWADEILARSDAYQRGELTARDWRESVDRVRQALQSMEQNS